MKRRAIAALVLSLSACEPPAPPPSPHASDALAFVDVTVIPFDFQRVLPHQTVVIEGGKIVALGEGVAVPPGARRVDGRGRFLMPGLADMHVHLTREEDLRLFLANGVTTVRNMWGTPRTLSWRARIERGELPGPSIYTAGPIVDGPKVAHDGSLVMRGPEDAGAVIALHKQHGYDFIKIYSRLPAPAFDALVAAAKVAGLPVAGHVPREVGMARMIDAGVASIEHLNSFDDALQADGSPLAGKYGGGAQEKKIDHVDRAKIPALARRLHDHGVAFCPTRNLLGQIAPAAEIEQRLTRPEMAYVPGYERAVWTAEGEPAAEMRDRFDRTIALGDELIRAVRGVGGRLLVGTDTGNPLVIPGYTLREELSLLIKAGLTPYEVLHAATAGAATFMGKGGEVGVVAVGQRADLLLLEGDPLADVANLARIAGVMARGRWYGAPELAALRADVERWAQGKKDPFAGVPPLRGSGTPELEATYLLRWKDVPFDHERLLVERLPSGERLIRAQTIDPHKGQWVTMHLAPGASGAGRWLLLESDGVAGTGRLEVTRRGKKALLSGTLLYGVPVAQEDELPESAKLGADHFLAGKILLSAELMQLDVGKSLEVRESEAALGSYAKLEGGLETITRTPDATLAIGDQQVPARRYEIATGKGKPRVLWLDDKGFPLGYDIPAYSVSLRRLPR